MEKSYKTGIFKLENQEKLVVLPRAEDGRLGLSKESKLALPLSLSSVHTLRGLNEALLPWGGPSALLS